MNHPYKELRFPKTIAEPSVPQKSTRPSSSTDLHTLQRLSNFSAETTKSPWECTTPMLSRPHFDKESPRPLRRTRARSLGSTLDGEPPQLHEWSLLRPKLEPTKTPSPQTSPIITSTAKPATQEAATPIWVSILYGMINATIVLPVLMSFGSIIYRDQAFSPYMPLLVKLTVVSGIVHQICFSTFSTLPFAVGQVQDAGLIFLSDMASSIVQYCRANHYDDDVLLATATIGLAGCTALLGIGLVIIGKLRLAQYVQMLPTSVVGGYLAYIGWFCGYSGIGIMTNDSNVTLATLLNHWMYILPGIAGGVVIYTSARVLRHMAVLPTCIVVLLFCFYGVLWLTKHTIEDATENGWIRHMDPPPSLWRTWHYLRFDKVAWSALPHLALTELSMMFVVALSSSLDVAAIELELGHPLDYNHELSTVGLSNIISGMTGGYTGSYIFSQSIFSLRAGIRSRLAGYSLAGCQILVTLLPFPLLSYVPNFFFGSLLSMICIDLMYEWLWDVRKKVTAVEYSICLATFVLIQISNVEYGIIFGVLLYLSCRKLGLDLGSVRIMTAGEQEDEERRDISIIGEINGQSKYNSI